MYTYTLLLQINKKLDMLLRMHGINSDQDSLSNTVKPGTYSKENAEILEKYKEQTG